jgi:hypothetical protein
LTQQQEVFLIEILPGMEIPILTRNASNLREAFEIALAIVFPTFERLVWQSDYTEPYEFRYKIKVPMSEEVAA